ncbi:hypothetical protein [Actibacterium sp. 188UL27-1]|uniref:hypothetical protein n=1 Tax=Actibacterium sp. 188UL27-1 TaxID=2786961 RepID=UPI00195D6799|nr:hypothetical protein [Actibacterium sp. 188UL27-1]MBM7066672.1 hypothetical protein [Actibacterium sp. 188UL27-1]
MSQAEIDRIIAVGLENNSAIPNRGIFYSWGGDNHLAHTLSGRNEAIFHQRYNQPVGGGSNAGPGLYISTSLYDSADYCPTDGSGILLQVDMPALPTMPYIRTTHIATMNALRRGSPRITTPMLFRNGPETPPILLQYAKTWHCLKTTKGVGLRKFDGRAHSAPDIAHAVRTMRNAGNTAAASVLLSQLRDEMRGPVEAAL